MIDGLLISQIKGITAQSPYRVLLEMSKIKASLNNALHKTKKHFRGKIITPHNQRLFTIKGYPESQ